jgi:GNAT superfamily N-acetyltransferase
VTRSRSTVRSLALEVRPLTPETWDDLVELFSRPGASIPRSCWCMFYRKSGAGADNARRDVNRAALRAIVDAGGVPGLIGYDDGSPVGWISLAPREEYEKLRRSPVMKPVDDRPVWSIVCFFVDKRSRGRGITTGLLDAAVRYADEQGATVVEAYPVDKPDRSVDDFMFFGSKRLFDRAGFEEVARRKPTRPVVRKAL